MKYMKSKIFTYLFVLIVSSLIILSYSACELFTFNELTELETNEEVSSKGSKDKNITTIVITPEFRDGKNPRSAYPQFTSEQLSSYKYFISGGFAFTEGSYNTTEKKIIFNVPGVLLDNKAVTVNVRAEISGSTYYLWSATKKMSCSIGETINETMYFSPYTYANRNGTIDLTVTTDSGYTIDCTVTNKAGEEVSGITVESAEEICQIKTGDDGVPYGTYIANFIVKNENDSQNIREFKSQEIVVWPGIMTDVWYLSDGSTDNTFNIPINKDEVTIYVKGSNPTGIYGSNGIKGAADAKDSNSGSILSPLKNISAALAKCESEDTKYTILLDGDFSQQISLGGSGVGNNKHNITITGGGGNASALSTVDPIYCVTDKSVTFRNLKIANQRTVTGAIYIASTESSATITIDNCTISKNMNNNAGGGIRIQAEACTVHIVDSIINQNQSTGATVGGTYYPGTGGGIYASDSGDLKLIIENTKITGNTADGSGGGIFFTNTSSSASNLTIKGSTYIPLSNNGQNDVYISDGKITVDGTLTPPEDCTDGKIAGVVINSAQMGYKYIFTENGADLETESQHFIYNEYPLGFDTQGQLDIAATEFFIASYTSTPAGDDTLGDGSASNPYASVAKAIQRINGFSLRKSWEITLKSDITENIIIDETTLAADSVNSLTIQGKAGSKKTIYGGGDSEHEVASIIHVNHTKHVVLKNLYITNKEASKGTAYAARGVYNNSNLVMEDCMLSYNIANKAEDEINGGGGILNAGVLSLSDVIISYNYSNGKHGGGIYNAGTLQIQNQIVVEDNKDYNTSSGLADNLYLAKNKSGTQTYIQVLNAPADSSIGVSTETPPASGEPVRITLGFDPAYEDEISADAAFYSDNATYEIITQSSDAFLKFIEPIASVNGTDYSKLSDVVNAIANASGSYTIKLYKGCTAAELGNNSYNNPATGTICYAIAQKTSDSITLEAEDGVKIVLPSDSAEIFRNCVSLVSLKLSCFDTSNVTRMEGMFVGCQNLSFVDVSGFDTSKVNNMRSMFANCKKITSLNLSSFKTPMLAYIQSMFQYCNSLETIYVSEYFSTSGIVDPDTSQLFLGCTKLKGGKGTEFNSSKTDKTYARADGGPSSDTPGYFTSVPYQANIVTSTNLDSIFNNMKTGTNKVLITGELDTSYLSALSTKVKALSTDKFIELDFSGVTNTSAQSLGRTTFAGCNQLTKVTYDLSSVSCTSYVFCNFITNRGYQNGCPNLKEIKVISASKAFDCSTPTSAQLKDALLLTSLEILDLTECRGRITINAQYLATDSDSSENPTLKKIKFGTYIADGSKLTNTESFTNSAFMLTYEGYRDEITTYNLTFSGSTKQPMIIQCHDGKKQYTTGNSSWSNVN